MKRSELLTGKTTEHLVNFQDGPFLIHKDANEALLKLNNAAKSDGIELSMTSSYRSYEAQKNIWNNKVSGLRPVLDSESRSIDLSLKTPEEIIFLILRWSAVPGGSRHHWGTDLDLFDKNTVPENYKIQLIPEEYLGNGIFNFAYQWLGQNMKDFGFFWPYQQDLGGIAPEPWHISYKPLSERFLEEFSFEVFLEHLDQSDFLLIKEVKENQEEIYQRFIQIGK